MSVGAASIAAAWFLSVLPLATEAAGWLALDDGGLPRLALALLAWIAIAGMPRAGAAASPRASIVGSLAVAVPVCVAALLLDLARGGQPRAAALLIACGLAMAGALASAAELARRSSGGLCTLHAVAWFALVPCAPLLAAALTWGASQAAARAPSWLATISAASPLDWTFRAAWPADTAMSIGAQVPFAPLAVACALWLSSYLSARRSAKDGVAA